MARADKDANREYSNVHRIDDRIRVQTEPSKIHAAEVVVPWIVANVQPGGTVVDIAGGVGTYASQIVRCSSLRVVGLDISERLVEIRNEDPLLPENVVGDMEALPFAPDRFDAAMFVACLHHVPDPLPALREAWRVVRPGGRIFALEPASLRAGRAGNAPIKGHEHEFRLSRARLVERVQAAGFEVEETQGRRITIRLLRPILAAPPLWAFRLGDRIDHVLRTVPALDRLGEMVMLRARKLDSSTQ